MSSPIELCKRSTATDATHHQRSCLALLVRIWGEVRIHAAPSCEPSTTRAHNKRERLSLVQVHKEAFDISLVEQVDPDNDVVVLASSVMSSDHYLRDTRFTAADFSTIYCTLRWMCPFRHEECIELQETIMIRPDFHNFA